MSDALVTLVVDGREVTTPAGRSIVEAVWAAGHTLVEHVGCLGQGVCGSCRAMVRRDGSPEVRFVLACETLAEPGMRVSFVLTATLVSRPANRLRRLDQLERGELRVDLDTPQGEEDPHG